MQLAQIDKIMDKKLKENTNYCADLKMLLKRQNIINRNSLLSL